MPIVSNILQHGKAVHPRHFDVEEKDARLWHGVRIVILSLMVEKVQTFLTVMDNIKGIDDVMLLPCPFGRQNVVLIILSHEDQKWIFAHIYSPFCRLLEKEKNVLSLSGCGSIPTCARSDSGVSKHPEPPGPILVFRHGQNDLRLLQLGCWPG